jgi:hypothetical protein
VGTWTGLMMNFKICVQSSVTLYWCIYLILHGWVLGSEGTISLCNIAKRVTILCTDHQQMTAILPTARHIDTKNNLWEYTFLKIDGKTHSNNNSFW